MTAQLPQLHEGRDGPKEQVKLINQLRRNLPGPAQLVFPVKVNLLVAGLTLAIPANPSGWITTAVDLVADEVVGVQTTGPDIRIGANASFTDVVPLTSLGTGLQVNEVVPVALTSPIFSLTNDIFIRVAIGSGPTTLTATVYISGYFR